MTPSDFRRYIWTPIRWFRLILYHGAQRSCSCSHVLQKGFKILQYRQSLVEPLWEILLSSRASPDMTGFGRQSVAWRTHCCPWPWMASSSRRPALKELTLKNVQLMPGPRKDPLDEFLNISKHRGTSSNTHRVAINFSKDQQSRIQRATPAPNPRTLSGGLTTMTHGLLRKRPRSRSLDRQVLAIGTWG